MYLQHNIKTSRERNAPRFERETSYVCSSLFLKPKMRELEKDQIMTTYNYQTFWCSRVILITKLDHYCTVSVYRNKNIIELLK